MRRMYLLLLLVLVPVSAVAQQGQSTKFDLTLTTGYRWGGDITVKERAVNVGDYDVGVTAAGTYGLRFGVALSEKLRVELMVNRQETRFMDNKGLFGEAPGSFVRPGDHHVLDVTIEHFHGGVTWDLGTGPYQWYVLGSLGITHINPQLPLPNETVFSAGIGAGVRFEMSDQLAFIIEARGYYVATDQNTSGTYEFQNKDCGNTCYITFIYGDSMVQTELTAGLVYRF